MLHFLNNHPRLSAAVICACLLATAGGSSFAGDNFAGDPVLNYDPPLNGSFLETEYALFGTLASSAWQVGDVGGSGIGGVKIDDGESSGPRDLGSKFTAGLLSLVLPGAGQYYNGDHTKAAAFVGAEAAVWAGYLIFNDQAGGYEQDYKQYAEVYAGVSGEHDDEYWRAMSRYLDGDAYNEALLRDARSSGIEPPALLDGSDIWQWRNQDYQYDYRVIRADAKRSYDRRDFMTAFAVVNRIVSVVDAVRSAGDDLLTMEVAGFQVDVDLATSLENPGTGCVISRAF